MDGATQLSPFSPSSILPGLIIGVTGSMLANLLYNFSSSRLKTWRGRSSARRATKRVKELEEELERFYDYKTNNIKFHASLFISILFAVLFLTSSIILFIVGYATYYVIFSGSILAATVLACLFGAMGLFLATKAALDGIATANMITFPDYESHAKKTIEDLKHVTQ